MISGGLEGKVSAFPSRSDNAMGVGKKEGIGLSGEGSVPMPRRFKECGSRGLVTTKACCHARSDPQNKKPKASLLASGRVSIFPLSVLGHFNCP